MGDDIYYELRDILDTIPNGYPSTENGLEIRILKKIFSEEEAEIAAKLKLKFETPEGIAERTGMDRDHLAKMLREMADKGEIFGVSIDGTDLYKMVPFVFGIYEYQLYRMDRELAEMIEEYMRTVFGADFHHNAPSLMKVVPIEKEIPHGSSVEPYESVTRLIENARSWAVSDCICKKEKRLLDHGCDNPLEVCLGLAPVDNFFETFFWGRPISKEDAFTIIKKSEEAGLVHMTSNTKEGHIYICNCCGCCCGMLRGINELGNIAAVAHSNYIAVVENDACTSCGICEERCQVGGITLDEVAVVNERCIGCGLCVSTCPSDAITMKRRAEGDILDVPQNEKEWMQRRGQASGRTEYGKLLK